MRMLNAWTFELDEPTTAVSEILEQLDLANNALTNSVGLITCSYDFIEVGMIKAICDALPFEVIGCTTLTNANNVVSGTMLFCLTVLTADDCQFITAVTESLSEDPEKAIKRASRKALNRLTQPPKLAIALFPLFRLDNDTILSTLDEALDETPIFGSIACDYDTATYSDSYVIHGGECYRDCLSFALIAGNVNPKFVVTSTSDQNLIQQRAIITSSENCLLKQVNNMSARDYLDSIGLIVGEGVEGMSSVPFVVDFCDGTQPVARAVYGFNEDGSAICGGVMPVGGTLYIGKLDFEDIIDTAEKSMKKLLSNGEVNGIIMFPCLGRNIVLALDPFAEINVLKQLVGEKPPIHLAYSAGECCPVYEVDGRTTNRFHNFTFIGCAF